MRTKKVVSHAWKGRLAPSDDVEDLLVASSMLGTRQSSRVCDGGSKVLGVIIVGQDVLAMSSWQNAFSKNDE